MRLFISIASARLAYGGPAVSVAALARSLARAGTEIGLWCPDGSAVTVQRQPGEERLHLLTGSLQAAITEFGMPDVVHDNGIWWQHNRNIARFANRHRVPRVVSLRGMLEPWARQHKPIRKTVAWHVYQSRDLRSASALHATSEQERGNIAALMPHATLTLIGNGLSLPAEQAMAFAGGNGCTRQALFLGRLHPVKGLPNLLRAWHLAAPHGWQLVLAGPDEQGHRRELEKIVAELGLGGQVSFTGPVTGEAKAQLLAASQLFLLPSHSESFGMAVGEALAHGLPVLTTRNVPWPQLERLDCGWRVEGSVDALAEGLGVATACAASQLAEMGKRGRALVADEFGWEKVAGRFIDLYSNLLTPSAKPTLP